MNAKPTTSIIIRTKDTVMNYFIIIRNLINDVISYIVIILAGLGIYFISNGNFTSFITPAFASGQHSVPPVSELIENVEDIPEKNVTVSGYIK